jgi:hypothetical protein
MGLRTWFMFKRGAVEIVDLVRRKLIISHIYFHTLSKTVRFEVTVKAHIVSGMKIFLHFPFWVAHFLT